ncbi:MAG: radical SAM protein [Magnetococcales bacterium]|nr:radical SAM protein [Magnetococcales bacterium]
MLTVKSIVTFYFRYILRRPALVNRALFYIPNWRGLFRTALNEINFLLRRDQGFRITSVVVELSGQCNLNCLHCARHQAMTREQGLMTWETFETLVKNNPDIPMFILVGWGEMMLHPDFFRMVEFLRQKGKRVALTTNATLLTRERIEKLVTSGLSHITFSVDGLDDVYQKMRGIPFEKVERNIIALAERIRQTGADIFLEINCVGHPDVLQQEKEIRQRLGPYLDDIRFSSFMEYNMLVPTNRSSPCREFWRGMISVLHDGRVVPCCMDYNASMVLGHISEGSLNSLWNNPVTRGLRREQLRLEFKRRCATCYENEPPAQSGINKRFD